ncbi:MAG: putative Ig domain-containing protein [Terracidiphilus sp.]
MTRSCFLVFVLAAFSAPQIFAADAARPILTPKPAAAAKINGPTVYGARPGHPFLYRIPCTGLRPVQFSAHGLPASLRLDASSGIISGVTPDKPGVYAVTLLASNAKGKSSRLFRIVVGETLALTPPMGWNDWYTYYDRVTNRVVRQAADAMISSGMADFGYQYVNIDGCWQMKPGSTNPELSGAPRDSQGTIRPNERFQDMASLTAYIHDKGLKAGLYSSPGPLDCAGFTGSYRHEEMDAKTFAAWGFDFLKYDWCSYGGVAPKKPSLTDFRKPYDLMGGILKQQDRDMVLNLCQYGMGDVWTWAADSGGNSWRTTGDLGMEKGSRLPGFYSIAFANASHSSYAGPGHWNDPDYLLIGTVGNALKSDEPQAPTSLTADEQYSYMSMWALMASPLFFGGDMTQLDDFTLGILCNSEVIDVDQDALGWQGRVVRQSEDEFIIEKPLEDGSVAVGLFNLSEGSRTMSVSLTDLGLNGSWKVRDLWRQKEIGAVSGSLSAEVAQHGVSFVQLTSTRRSR